MGYKVKWIENHLGISRKALRNFEKLGLMPPNLGGRYRDYSDDDIERIWKIRLLQGMGYSLKEIIDLEKCDVYEFDDSLAKKIKELEEKKAKIDNHLGYAQLIKFSGRIPASPKIMGSMTFDEFYEKSLGEWNVNSNPEIKRYAELVNSMLYATGDALSDSDLGKMIEFIQDFQSRFTNKDAIFADTIIPSEIIKRKENGPSDAEVQLLVKILYENRISCFPEFSEMTKHQFVRIESTGYISGDIAHIRHQEYGREGCLFMADAIAVFGGYRCYDDIED